MLFPISSHLTLCRVDKGRSLAVCCGCDLTTRTRFCRAHLELLLPPKRHLAGRETGLFYFPRLHRAFHSGFAYPLTRPFTHLNQCKRSECEWQILCSTTN